MGGAELPSSARAAFAIHELIGQGAFGRVRRATHSRTGHQVAIKQLPLEDAHSLAQLCREVERLSSMRHECIVAYYCAFQASSQLWIVMELAGDSLADVRALADLSEDHIAAACSCALDGLAYLHSQSVLHLDVRAANLMLSSAGLVKLADFGLATKLITGTAINAELGRKTKQRFMTELSYWMAPELVQACLQSPLDAHSTSLKSGRYSMAADVWSLGVTAIELADGAPPHREMRPEDALSFVPLLPSPTLAQPGAWSSRFGSFLLAALMKQPEKRADVGALRMHQFYVCGNSARRRGMLRSLGDSCRPSLLAQRLFHEHGVHDYRRGVQDGSPRSVASADEVPNKLSKPESTARALAGPRSSLVLTPATGFPECMSSPFRSSTKPVGSISPELGDVDIEKIKEVAKELFAETEVLLCKCGDSNDMFRGMPRMIRATSAPMLDSALARPTNFRANPSNTGATDVSRSHSHSGAQGVAPRASPMGLTDALTSPGGSRVSPLNESWVGRASCQDSSTATADDLEDDQRRSKDELDEMGSNVSRGSMAELHGEHGGHAMPDMMFINGDTGQTESDARVMVPLRQDQTVKPRSRMPSCELACEFSLDLPPLASPVLDRAPLPDEIPLLASALSNSANASSSRLFDGAAASQMSSFPASTHGEDDVLSKAEGGGRQVEETQTPNARKERQCQPLPRSFDGHEARTWRGSGEEGREGRDESKETANERPRRSLSLTRLSADIAAMSAIEIDGELEALPGMYQRDVERVRRRHGKIVAALLAERQRKMLNIYPESHVDHPRGGNRADQATAESHEIKAESSAGEKHGASSRRDAHKQPSLTVDLNRSNARQEFQMNRSRAGGFSTWNILHWNRRSSSSGEERPDSAVRRSLAPSLRA